MKSILLAACATMTLTLFVFACSSPAGEGGDFATKENQLFKDVEQELNDLNKNLSKDIDAGKYASRHEAKEAWLARHRELMEHLQQGTQDIYQEMEELESSMEIDKYSELEDAFEKGRDHDMQLKVWERLNDTVIPNNVLNSISKIKPVKPDEKQIQKDLAHSIFSQATDGGYFEDSYPKINAEDYDITNLSVAEVEKDNNSEYVIHVTFRLVGKVNTDRQIDVTCKVRYKLPQYDDWTIDFVQSESITPVKTDTYDGCVRLFVSSGWSGGLSVENKCDKALEVYVRFYEYGQWKKKIVVANAQGTNLIDYGSPNERIIDYVLPL